MSEPKKTDQSGAGNGGDSLATGLELFHPAVREWFQSVFPAPTRPQRMGWAAIARGDSTLILAPTGTGKTLAAFLWCINRAMFAPAPGKKERCRVIYISPIKALAVDVERNLQVPLAGIAETAERLGAEYHEPLISIRTGDTPSAERGRFARNPGDILITTPESLYLLLTSNARENLRPVETVIIDEIHALVPTKRGVHLALSIERLEHLCGRRLQRIGLSATQRPLEEVAHYLGGCENTDEQAGDSRRSESSAGALTEFEPPEMAPAFRPVTILNASEPKRLDLKVEVPVEDMARLGDIEAPRGPAADGFIRKSIWSAIHPKLLELVRAHRSTLIFVNNRRLAEQTSGALNELAGETLVRAHHGSVAVTQRKEIEDLLKRGLVRGLVATSSLELGIDMGAIDLVVQVESPPSVATGMQRVGRASHHVGAVSNAVIFPKHRADLVACAAITRAMYDGDIESTRYPRNALDVLAQQIVAMVALEAWGENELFQLIRGAAPYAGLTRFVFEGVLNMLAGRYPSAEFAELRPRITWDRARRRFTGRQGARSVAVINGGTIPDRGLYGVFLADAKKGARVGELDEEMVFESKTGETIILGASTWRIQEILQDRVIVAPAPGEPGKMPFWHGDAAGRPAEFGERIGKMMRELLQLPRPVAFSRLIEEHSLDANAAENVLRYLDEQIAATKRIPSDEDILIETCRDELGDRRVCVLTPFGRRVHVPWCMAATAKIRAEYGMDVEAMWSDDGFVIRFPDGDDPVPIEALLPTPAEFKELVLRELGATSLFAARFREAAARALLLPKHRPGMRAPLWQQRKRATDLLAVASRYPSFPIVLETYRECIRDFFDLPFAANLLARIGHGEVRVTTADSEKPSPFAASLLFSYVANYIYDGDAPLAERRAQALSIDQSQLQELLGDADLREILDESALEEVEARIQSLAPDYRARHVDGVHDLLLRLGDLSRDGIAQRSVSTEVAAGVDELVQAGRAAEVRIAGAFRYIAAEYAAHYRDALGISLPAGLAAPFLKPAEAPLYDIVHRYARTHGPFTTADLADRYGVQASAAEPLLRSLHGSGKLLEGEFRPSGRHREWCDPDVLQQIRRKSLARLRREIEPVEPATFARFATRWHGLVAPRRGLNALLDSIETLQGAAIPVTEVEREVFAARIRNYQPSDLDTLMATGEVAWVGVERVGERDGLVALYLAKSLPSLMPPQSATADDAALSSRALRIVEFLERRGASFFVDIHQGSGDGYPGETLDALWELVWSSEVTNDTFHPLRHWIRPPETSRHRSGRAEGQPGSPDALRGLQFRLAASGPAQGRWSLIRTRVPATPTETQWSVNLSQQLLARHGIVMRETAIAEAIPGGYPSVYPALRMMEESGRVRRGMFVAGVGAAQFALPAAVELLRGLRTDPSPPEATYVAATDPANPFGSVLPWPRTEDESEESAAHHTMARVSGAGAILVNGRFTAFLRRRNPSLRVFLPEDEPERTSSARALAQKLAELAMRRQTLRSGLLIGLINEAPAREHFLAAFLKETGFVDTASGFQMRRVRTIQAPVTDPDDEEDDEGEVGSLTTGD
ncbi:MAG TPA: DEAD/DEAH box helicase [Candidatus Aquilonibacter sp.]|nr:DEAD/DEAH box helicase [Candidatus Aquilonibacter sp.]